jgi:rubrerythrin
MAKDETGIPENITPEAAVRMAMERERRAGEFYGHCAATVNDPGVKRLFLFLEAEERRHFELLEREHDRFLTPEN